MGNYVHLVGAEEVSRAASQMSFAAQEMGRAASYLESVVEQQRRNMDDFLQRLEDILGKGFPHDH